MITARALVVLMFMVSLMVPTSCQGRLLLAKRRGANCSAGVLEVIGPDGNLVPCDSDDEKEQKYHVGISLFARPSLKTWGPVSENGESPRNEVQKHFPVILDLDVRKGKLERRQGKDFIDRERKFGVRDAALCAVLSMLWAASIGAVNSYLSYRDGDREKLMNALRGSSVVPTPTVQNVDEKYEAADSLFKRSMMSFGI